MPTTTISAAEWRINERLSHLADAEHWNITPQLLKRIIREAGRAANQPRPVDIEQPGKSAAARATRLAALERETTPSTVAVGECHLGSCTDSPKGWRLYVHEGWRPVCTRHMGAAKVLARVLNRDLGAGGEA